MENEHKQQGIDIAVLKEQMTGVRSDVSSIMNNHLPHIQAKVDKIDKKLAYYSGAVVGSVSILELIFKFLLK